jgi:hypothetical protein
VASLLATIASRGAGDPRSRAAAAHGYVARCSATDRLLLGRVTLNPQSTSSDGGDPANAG